MSLKALFFLFLVKNAVSLSADIKCGEDFCGEYLASHSCEVKVCDPSENEAIISSPDPCGCCEFCVKYLNEGEECVQGTVNTIIPHIMCGPGLYCENEHCKNMTNPDIDPAKFEPYVCDNGICRCRALDENSLPALIFGEFNETNLETNETQCACAQTAYKAQKQINRFIDKDNVYQPVSRCLSTGQFDRLQCFGIWCVCVDKETGELEYDTQPVTISNLQKDVPHCFDPLIHTPKTYYTECEIERNAMFDLRDSASLEKFQIIESHDVNCLPDGSYA